MKCHLYVSLLKEDKILIFTVDTQTGKLQAQGEMKVSGQPANMAFDPGQQFVYVGRKAAGQSQFTAEIVKLANCRPPAAQLWNSNRISWRPTGKAGS